MKYPRVMEVNHVKTICPNMSSETGYSEPDVFKFKYDTGESVTRIIDVQCRPHDVVAQTCKECCYSLPILNSGEAFEMMLKYYLHD